jgi:hypothetical protein
VPWLTSVDGWPVESVPPLTDIRQLGRCQSSQLTSTAVVVPHANHGGRVTAPVASQWNVSEERIAVRALATDQERPGHVSDPATLRAGRSRMRVALALRLGSIARARLRSSGRCFVAYCIARLPVDVRRMSHGIARVPTENGRDHRVQDFS